MLYVAEAFGGGIYELIRIQANELVARGHDVAVAFGIRPETPDNVREDFDDAVELFPMPWRRRTLKAQIDTARKLRPLARSWKPDIVHLYSSFAGVVGALALPRNLNTIYSPQAYAFTMRSTRRHKRFVYASGEKLISRRVDRVVAASASEAEIARGHLGVKNVDVVENGVPELNEPVAKAADSPATKRVVAMGRLRPQRQPEACARILGRVKDIAEVRWIGGGDSTGAEANALAEVGVPVTGWLEHEEVVAELGAATAYLHWTGWDGLALSVLEAMARDVVVIASDIGPNREALGPNQVCATEEAASELLRRVIEEPDLRQAFLESQRENRRRYSANHMVDQWVSLYSKMISVRQR